MVEINRKNARIWSMMGARGTFGEIVTELAQDNNNLVVTSADLSRLSGLDSFKEKFPQRFINVGIAEQNLIGISAGLAKEGMIVFATSFATFITMRCCEQVRVYMAMMKLPVITIGLCAGLEAGYYGNSHYGIEDAGVMRCIPNMTVVSPADGIEIAKVMQAALDYKKPMYIRLTGTNNLPIVYTKDYDFQIGKAVELAEGEDIAIIAAGTMVSQALVAAKQLENEGISTAVINMHTIKPIDKEIIQKYALKVKNIFTIEEHSIYGGLGSAVAEVISEISSRATLTRIGIPDSFEKAGSYSYMLDKFGLTSERIKETILNKLKCK